MKRFVSILQHVPSMVACTLLSIVFLAANVSCKDFENEQNGNNGNPSQGGSTSSVSFHLSCADQASDTITDIPDDDAGHSKTIAPKPNLMTVASYSVQGTGPNESSFGPLHSKQSSMSVDGLCPGQWTIVARAYNQNGNELLSGTTSCTLEGGPNTVSMVLGRMTGEGSVQVSFKWSSALSSSSSIRIVATFEDDKGSRFQESIDARVSSGGAELRRRLPAGSYVMTVRVTDALGLNRGCAEAIRIVSGETSIGVVNLAGSASSLEISMDGHVRLPIIVYATCKPVGGGFILSASYDSLPSGVSESSLKYKWFCDGEAVGFSKSITVSSSNISHRYDVVVSCGMDGTTGSASVTVT